MAPPCQTGQVIGWAFRAALRNRNSSMNPCDSMVPDQTATFRSTWWGANLLQVRAMKKAPSQLRISSLRLLLGTARTTSSHRTPTLMAASVCDASMQLPSGTPVQHRPVLPSHCRWDRRTGLPNFHCKQCHCHSGDKHFHDARAKFVRRTEGGRRRRLSACKPHLWRQSKGPLWTRARWLLWFDDRWGWGNSLQMETRGGTEPFPERWGRIGRTPRRVAGIRFIRSRIVDALLGADGGSLLHLAGGRWSRASLAPRPCARDATSG